MDTDLCTLNEHCCGSHTCQSTPRNCDDGNICTDDICNPASGCVHSPNSVACNDGDLCTTGDKCNAGTCAGIPVSCSDGNYCDGAETCNEGGLQAGHAFVLAGRPQSAPDLHGGMVRGRREQSRRVHGEEAYLPAGRLDLRPRLLRADLHLPGGGVPARARPAPPFTSCTLADVNGYELPRSLLRRNVGIAAALMAALDSLPGARVQGMFSNELTFSPAVDHTECTPLFSVPVALGKKVTLKGSASTITGIHDKDKLKLACTAG